MFLGIFLLCATLFLGTVVAIFPARLQGIEDTYAQDSPKSGLEVSCHLNFHGEEADIKDIRNLITLPNTAQSIEEIKIVDEYSGRRLLR